MGGRYQRDKNHLKMEKKPKKQVVTGDKTQDAKKVTKDSDKQIAQG